MDILNISNILSLNEKLDLQEILILVKSLKNHILYISDKIIVK